MSQIPKVTLRKIERAHGPVYLLDYWVNGKRVRQSVGSNKRQAEAIQAKVQRDLTLGTYGIHQQSDRTISVSELVKEYLAEDSSLKSAKTIKRYEDQLLGFEKFLGNFFPDTYKDITRIKAYHVSECRDKLIKGFLPEQKAWAPRTVNRTLEMIGGLLNFAVEKSYIDINPAKGTRHIPVPEKGVPEFYSKDELVKIWEKADSYWLPFFKFLYYTGMRKGEAINLIWSNVHNDAAQPYVEIKSTLTWKTKTKKSRVVHLSKSASEIIKGQVDKHPTYVFPAKSGGKVHDNVPYRSLIKTLDKLNIPGDLHKFRHSFASHLAMEGVSRDTIGDILGHSSSEMTKIYAHLSPEHKQSVVNKLG